MEALIKPGPVPVLGYGTQVLNFWLESGVELPIYHTAKYRNLFTAF